jgi:hypothetical protein
MKDPGRLAGQLEGLIPLFGGIYGLLLAKGILPRNPKEPEKWELWRRKFGPLTMILAPLLIVFGCLKLLGVFI